MNLVLALAALIALPVAQETPSPALAVTLPEVAGATADPTCGGRAELARIAFCIASTQVGMQGVADAYSTAFNAQGWLVGAGDDNRVVFVRRKDGGGCEAFQMQAFADEARTPGPAAPAYLAFATIPGDVCTSNPEAAGS